MSVLLVRYLLSIFILPTTVMMTPRVPTPKDPSTALVLQDTLEMVSLVLVMMAYLKLFVTGPTAPPIIHLILFRTKQRN